MARDSECCYAECHYTECCYTECHYAECCHTECHYAECRGVDYQQTQKKAKLDS